MDQEAHKSATETIVLGLPGREVQGPTFRLPARSVMIGGYSSAQLGSELSEWDDRTNIDSKTATVKMQLHPDAKGLRDDIL